MNAPSGFSRYALKQRLVETKAAVAIETGFSVALLGTAYRRWLADQRKRVGRAVHKGRTEEIACELLWLEDFRKRTTSKAA